MVKGVVLILGVVCFTFCGCKNDQLSTEIEKIVKEWTGKKIIFPQDVFCKSIDRDTLCISPNSTPYKILVYTDSIGCTSCKLHLLLLRKLMTKWQVLLIFNFIFILKISKKYSFYLERTHLNILAIWIYVINLINSIHFPKTVDIRLFCWINIIRSFALVILQRILKYGVCISK